MHPPLVYNHVNLSLIEPTLFDLLITVVQNFLLFSLTR